MKFIIIFLFAYVSGSLLRASYEYFICDADGTMFITLIKAWLCLYVILLLQQIKDFLFKTITFKEKKQ